MELALILRELFSRRRMLALGAGVALIVAVLSVYRVDGFGLKSRSLQYSSATTTVFVDTQSSVLGNVTQTLEPLQTRATAYANFMASPTIVGLIGQQVGISGAQIYAAGPIDPNVPRIVQEPTAVKRNVEITVESTPYRLNFDNDPNVPTIGSYAQAPTTKQSIALANAAASSLAQYVSNVQASDQTPAQSRVVIRQLGSATGGVVDGGISKALATIVFIVVFLLWCVSMLIAVRFREYWRASADVELETVAHGRAADRHHAAEPGRTVADPDAARDSDRRTAANGTAPPRVEEPGRVAALSTRMRPTGT